MKEYNNEGFQLEIRQLRSFCVAAALRSISKASTELGIAQPTVTVHIGGLEKELGVKLFERGRRPISLTAAGIALTKLAKPIVDGIEAIKGNLDDVERHSPVIIGAIFDIVSNVLLESVKTFRSRNPHIPLHIRSGNSANVLQMVKEGSIDLGVIPSYGPPMGVFYKRLFTYEWVLFARLGHPILQKPIQSLSSIADYPLFMMEPGTFTRSLLEQEFRRNGCSWSVAIESNSMDNIKRYVAIGTGVSVGPSLAVNQADLDELGVVNLTHLLGQAEVGVVAADGQRLSDNARQYMAILETQSANRL
jgi:DNA-binding transcriptional LysR family regulator